MVTSDVTTRTEHRPPERRGSANPRLEFGSQLAPAAMRFVLFMGTWNVRTLVNMDDDLNTASKNIYNSKRQLSEERKIDLVCRQLQHYSMDIVGLQETLWFGTNSYQVDDCLVLASGHPTPSDGESARQGEGVAIVLCGRSRDAFVHCGSQWTGHSSRLVSAWVKFESGRNHSPLCIHIAVGYAPTSARLRTEKTALYDSLQTYPHWQRSKVKTCIAFLVTSMLELEFKWRGG